MSKIEVTMVQNFFTFFFFEQTLRLKSAILSHNWQEMVHFDENIPSLKLFSPFKTAFSQLIPSLSIKAS